MSSYRIRRRQLIASTALAAVLLTGGGLTAVDLGIPGLDGGAAYAESCCFTPETLVLMADGTERPIGRILPGDVVVGGDGRLNRVIGVERVPLGSRRLYAINDGAPFFTPEHPFLTAGGWRSVSPSASFFEVPSLEIRELALGDLLVTAAPGPAIVGATALALDVQRGLVRLVRLWSAPGDENMVVFNLMLDGDHTFVANGLVVHNKGGEGGGDADGGDSDGGESGGSDGGDSDGGESGESDSSGPGDGSESDSDGGESGESDDGGDSDDGGESGESDDGGESGESEDGGESGESGDSDDGGESGDNGSGGFEGSAEPAGRDLTPEEERDVISRGWK